MKYYLLPLLMAIILTACSEPHNQKLNDINSYLNEHPTQPLDVRPTLDSINYNSLSERDQIFHDLLSIKISDLNFEKHTSDTLINKILDYTDKHPDVSFRCEALYYGGIVYSVLGDFPTALKYYQQALDNVKTTSDSVIMLGKIYAQMGGLLDRLRLFDEAIPLFESVIEQDIVRGDTINEVNDLLYLGQIYIRKDEPEKAKKYFSKVLEKKTHLSPQTKAKSKMLLASAYKSLNNDTALVLIKEALDSIDSYTRWNALAQACWIYKKFGRLDTAYMYADELIHGDSRNFKETGYRIALSNTFQDYTPVDSLKKYIGEFNEILEHDLNSNQQNLTLMQHTMYNYNLHEQARAETEKKNRTLFFWICIVAVALLLSVWLFTLRILHNKKKIIELQSSLEKLRKIEASMNIKPAEPLHEENKLTAPPKATVSNLRDELREKITAIAEQSDTKELDPVIATSAVYKKIQDSIESKKIIDRNIEFWKELEEIIFICSPEFRDRLAILTNGLITTNEYHTALLIKCNIRQADIATLSGRTQNTIASRKKSISKKIYGEKLEPTVIDSFIKSI